MDGSRQTAGGDECTLLHHDIGKFGIAGSCLDSSLKDDVRRY